FYPRAGDESAGCFIAEPLAALIKGGARSTVFAVEPMHRARVKESQSAPSARWFRYPAIPGNKGLASARTGVHLLLRESLRSVHSHSPVDLIHAHGALPCGDAARRLSKEFKIPYVVTVHGLDAYSTVQVQGWPGRPCAAVSRKVYTAARKVI